MLQQQRHGPFVGYDKDGNHILKMMPNLVQVYTSGLSSDRFDLSYVKEIKTLRGVSYSFVERRFLKER